MPYILFRKRAMGSEHRKQRSSINTANTLLLGRRWPPFCLLLPVICSNDPEGSRRRNPRPTPPPTLQSIQRTHVLLPSFRPHFILVYHLCSQQPTIKTPFISADKGSRAHHFFQALNKRRAMIRLLKLFAQPFGKQGKRTNSHDKSE